MAPWSLARRSPRSKSADLAAFLCDHYWLKREAFANCDDVFRTLGIVGDDCFDFIQELAADFDVDLTDYDWSKFHLSEGEVLFDPFSLIRWAFGVKRGELDPKRALTPIGVPHLEAVIRERRWFDPAASG